MTSRLERQTPKELRTFFNESLKSAIELGLKPKHNGGLDPDTRKALEQIANEYPKSNPESIIKARKAFDDFMAWLTS